MPKKEFDKEDKSPEKKKWTKSSNTQASKPSYKNTGERKSFSPRGEKKEYGDRPKRNFEDKRPPREGGYKKREEGERKSFSPRGEKKEYGDRPKRNFEDKRPPREGGYKKREEGERKSFAPRGEKKEFGDRPKRNFEDKRPPREGGYKKREEGERKSFAPRGEKSKFPKRDYGKNSTGGKRENEKNFFQKQFGEPKKKRIDFKIKEDHKEEVRKNMFVKKQRLLIHDKEEKIEEQMPLNKFIARAGVCSRREAAELIRQGLVKVNDEVMLEPAYKVLDDDKIFYDGQLLNESEKKVYFLLNKPKDFITTADDPKGRKTVMDLFSQVRERIFPVGRLDRNTTGLLLMTNDGNLAQKLSHPKFNSKKVYQVTLDKNLSEKDFEKIKKGLELEDGKAIVDALEYSNPDKLNEIGIEIHQGKNRIVRRIFEHLGYEVKYLDRVMYAGLTKKNLPRGKWRALSREEIIYLKHFK